MGLFRRTSRKVGRVAKNVAKNVILPPDDSDKAKAGEAAEQGSSQHSDAEYEELKEKYDALMRAKWEEYYKTSCDGECETCEYYDWCPDDFDDDEAQAVEGDEAGQPAAEAEDGADEETEGESAEEQEPERELTEEERAEKEAAEAYYEAGCDGECETCEHYDWCPAEVEGEENPDDKVLFKGITQGDVKKVAKDSVELAREGAMAAKELKEAMDDILGGFDLKSLTK